jgi:hypothetical protein
MLYFDKVFFRFVSPFVNNSLDKAGLIAGLKVMNGRIVKLVKALSKPRSSIKQYS